MCVRDDLDKVSAHIFDIFVEELLCAGKHLEAFEKFDTRMEAWFQGQLVKTINTYTYAEWMLLEVGKKVGDDGRQPDLFLRVGDTELAIEIKSMALGRRDLRMYLRKSFGRDLSKAISSPRPMRLLTVAFPITSELKWADFIEAVQTKSDVVPVIVRDVHYGHNRIARAVLWKRSNG